MFRRRGRATRANSRSPAGSPQAAAPAKATRNSLGIAMRPLAGRQLGVLKHEKPFRESLRRLRSSANFSSRSELEPNFRNRHAFLYTPACRTPSYCTPGTMRASSTHSNRYQAAPAFLLHYPFPSHSASRYNRVVARVHRGLNRLNSLQTNLRYPLVKHVRR